MIYLDSSLLVAALCAEAKSSDVYAWLDANRDELLVISNWTLTEVASAVVLKRRMGALAAEEMADVFGRWEIMQDASLHRENIESVDFAEAAMLIRECRFPLRSGDALHLAVAVRLGASLATLDQGMIAASGFFGTATYEI
jgi:uncharacterized protein